MTTWLKQQLVKIKYYYKEAPYRKALRINMVGRLRQEKQNPKFGKDPTWDLKHQWTKQQWYDYHLQKKWYQDAQQRHFDYRTDLGNCKPYYMRLANAQEQIGNDYLKAKSPISSSEKQTTLSAQQRVKKYSQMTPQQRQATYANQVTIYWNGMPCDAQTYYKHHRFEIGVNPLMVSDPLRRAKLDASFSKACNKARHSKSLQELDKDMLSDF